MPIFAVTIFTAAFLLFQVQPIIAKYILPWFGGSPSVWTTAMLFFQALLLGGYAYAHFSIRYFRPRGQAALHLALLVVGLALLPITPAEHWKPEAVDAPTPQILLLLLVTLGWPFLVLASTSPLLQAWFTRLRPGVSPYRLYALSNVGSLLALVSYPVLVEPAIGRTAQTQLWSGGFGLFAVLSAACAMWIWRQQATLAISDTADATRPPTSPRPPTPPKSLTPPTPPRYPPTTGPLVPSGPPACSGWDCPRPLRSCCWRLRIRCRRTWLRSRSYGYCR